MCFEERVDVEQRAYSVSMMSGTKGEDMGVGGIGNTV